MLLRSQDTFLLPTVDHMQQKPCNIHAGCAAVLFEREINNAVFKI